MTSQRQKGCNGMVISQESQIGRRVAVLLLVHWYDLFLYKSAYAVLVLLDVIDVFEELSIISNDIPTHIPTNDPLPYMSKKTESEIHVKNSSYMTLDKM